MPTITLANLRAEVGYAADVSIQATGRYTNAMVLGWINEALGTYATLRAEYAGADDARTTVTGSASTALVQGFPQNQILALPANFLKLRAVWVTSPSGQRAQLDWSAESDRFDWTLQLTGVPQACRVTTLPDGSSALRVWPAMGAAYTFEIIYVPGPVALAADGDTWFYETGTRDIVVCEVACAVLDRDGVPEPTQYQALQNRIAKAEEKLRKILCTQDSGVKTVRDTRGIARAQARRDWLFR